VRRTKRASPRAQTVEQIRRAALRRWDSETTADSMAMRLGIPSPWLLEALSDPIERVTANYTKGCTAGDLARELALPCSFVVWVFRWLNATRRAGVS
jgi:hypothetical protein